ncbi:MAG: helix-turn-helix transcriptional regulator [Pseudomonadota bacterium]
MKHPVDVHVGLKIRQRRWMAGLTQQQLGETVGIKFQQVQKYETGVNRVSASRLWDIANALSVPVSFFFEGYRGEEGATGRPARRANGANGSMPPADVLADREAMELVRSYYAIPEDQRRRLFDLARVLSKAS